MLFVIDMAKDRMLFPVFLFRQEGKISKKDLGSMLITESRFQNRVRSKVSGECDTDYHFGPLILLCLPHFTGQDHASDLRF